MFRTRSIGVLTAATTSLVACATSPTSKSAQNAGAQLEQMLEHERYADISKVDDATLCRLFNHPAPLPKSSRTTLIVLNDRNIHECSGYGVTNSVPSLTNSNRNEILDEAFRDDINLIADQTALTFDEYKGTTKLVGPTRRSGNSNSHAIRGWEINGSWTYQIYVRALFFHGWAFLGSVYKDGQRADVTVIDRDVNCYPSGCTHHEYVGVNLTEDELFQAAHTGYKAKISGRGGETIISVPQEEIIGVLTKAGRYSPSAP